MDGAKEAAEAVQRLSNEIENLQRDIPNARQNVVATRFAADHAMNSLERMETRLASALTERAWWERKLPSHANAN